MGDGDTEGKRARQSGRVESTKCGRGGGRRMTQKSTPPRQRAGSVPALTRHTGIHYNVRQQLYQQVQRKARKTGEYRVIQHKLPPLKDP